MFNSNVTDSDTPLPQAFLVILTQLAGKNRKVLLLRYRHMVPRTDIITRQVCPIEFFYRLIGRTGGKKSKS